MKSIHGDGSARQGDALRDGPRKSLLRLKRQELVTRVIFGEKWSVFEEDSRYVLECCTELRSARDPNRSYNRDTIVVLVG